MSELTKLLEGVKVEWKSLGVIANLITTGRLNANAMDENGTYPFFTCNERPYRINEFAFDLEAILISGNGSKVGHINYYNGKFNAYQRTYVIGELSNDIKMMYLLHYLNFMLKNYIKVNSKKGSVPYITMPMLEQVPIPIPCPDNPEKSLKIQEEIVRILDSLSEETNQLTAALQKELDLHQKRYDFYREELFKFEGKEVEWRILGDVLKIKNGKDYKGYRKGEIPVYGSGGVLTYIDTHIFDKPSVLIPRKGSLKNLFYVTDPFWTVDTIFWTQININVVEPKYVFHYLLTQRLEELNMAGGVPSLTQTILNKVPVPVPTLQEQNRIVKILDNLDAETKAITKAIQKEIALRHKQYEYYRDRLLSFQSLQTEAEAIQ